MASLAGAKDEDTCWKRAMILDDEVPLSWLPAGWLTAGYHLWRIFDHFRSWMQSFCSASQVLAIPHSSSVIQSAMIVGPEMRLTDMEVVGPSIESLSRYSGVVWLSRWLISVQSGVQGRWAHRKPTPPCAVPLSVRDAPILVCLARKRISMFPDK